MQLDTARIPRMASLIQSPFDRLLQHGFGAGNSAPGRWSRRPAKSSFHASSSTAGKAAGPGCAWPSPPHPAPDPPSSLPCYQYLPWSTQAAPCSHTYEPATLAERKHTILITVDAPYSPDRRISQWALHTAACDEIDFVEEGRKAITPAAGRPVRVRAALSIAGICRSRKCVRQLLPSHELLQVRFRVHSLAFCTREHIRRSIWACQYSLTACQIRLPALQSYLHR